MDTSTYNKLAIAPMIDWTYSNFRIFMRILAPQALLYTEMLTADAIIHNPNKSLFFQDIEQPLALQLGGSDKDKLAIAAKKAAEAGFDEVNLNLGCPSDRVQSGYFGACLMKNKNLVSACIQELKNAVDIPVTAKIRIGVDDLDSYEFFADFVEALVAAGTDKIIIHARKAWLKGLSPKQNRTIPKVNYDYVYKIKEKYPDIPIIINGDIKTIIDINKHLSLVDGVMLGRLAYENPYAIADIANNLYPQTKLLSRTDILGAYLEQADFSNFNLAVKPLYNIYHGQPGAKAWKQNLMQVQQAKNIDKLKALIFDSNLACV